VDQAGTENDENQRPPRPTISKGNYKKEPASTAAGENRIAKNRSNLLSQWWCEFWYGWTRHQRLQAGFDGLLVIFTCGLLWTSCEQWQVARQSLSTSQQAFLYVSSMSFERRTAGPVTKASDLSNLVINITNSGNTPALQASTYVNYKITTLPLDYDYPDCCSPDDKHRNPILIGPKETYC
jgi:hypothetical protein